jgi:hypothetical protein
LENLLHATIHPRPNPITFRSQHEFDLSLGVDENFIIIFECTGTKSDKTSAHPLVEGTTTTNLPPTT